jgi:NAD(P)-dependent dehydrogenase (short-subunit alcohol dehydrogenase family)
MNNGGKTVFITGAGRGLGRNAALAFAKAGFMVGMCGLNMSDLENAAGEIREQGGKCHYDDIDVRDVEGMERLIKDVSDRLGPVSVVVNNAAIIGPSEFLTPSWSDAIDINLKGVMATTQAALPIMLEQGHGTIISIISGLAWMPFPRFSAYCASKAAVHHLTRCWAEEFSDSGIFFYSFDPGVMDTDMQTQIRSLEKERLGPVWKQFQEMKSQNRLKEPSNVAEALVRLVVERPAGKNGESVSSSSY